jgi:uncharacterized protein
MAVAGPVIRLEGRCCVVLARAPTAPGKTRLTRNLSADRARALREALLLDTLDAVRGADLPIVIAFTPEEARDEMARLAPDVTLIPQRGDDLGQRMRCAMQDVFDAGARDAVLIGSDVPTLPPQHLLQAFAVLDSGAHVVFGPSEDGGFYLVGARGEMPDVFHAIDWAAANVLERVLDASRAANVTIGTVPRWWDIDCPEDLRRLDTSERALPAPDASGERPPAHRVRTYLDSAQHE